MSKHLDVPALEALFTLRKARFSRGIDRVDSDRFEKILTAEAQKINQKVVSGGYKFSPYLEMLVSKGRDKYPRVIARATVRDKLLLTALKNILHEALPLEVPRKLPNQVVRELLQSLSLNREAEIIRGDITSFYDNISHLKLRQMLGARLGCEKLIGLLMQAITTAVVPPNYRRVDLGRYANKRGVPQGLPISNFLANLFLTKFDERMAAGMPAYHRYVDDIIVVSNKDERDDAIDKLARSLGGLGLKLNREKTKTFQFSERFEFLGYEVQDGLCRPRLASVEKYIRGIASLFAQFRVKRLPGRKGTLEWTDEEFGDVFVEELNERITGAISQHKQYGWVFYFNESTDLSTFSRVDKIVKAMARRTPNLTNEMRGRIKSLTRSYFESKYSKANGYIANYDLIESNKDKLRFLLRMGYADKKNAENMSPAKVNALFREVISQRLARLDQDVGLVS